MLGNHTLSAHVLLPCSALRHHIHSETIISSCYDATPNYNVIWCRNPTAKHQKFVDNYATPARAQSSLKLSDIHYRLLLNQGYLHKLGQITADDVILFSSGTYRISYPL